MNDFPAAEAGSGPWQTLRVLPIDFTITHTTGEPPTVPPGEWWSMTRTPEGTTVILVAEHGELWKALQR